MGVLGTALYMLAFHWVKPGNYPWAFFLYFGSILLLYSILSLPLAFINNPWRWGGWALAVLLLVGIYYLFLTRLIGSWKVISLLDLYWIIGVVLMAFIVVHRILRYQTKDFFGDYDKL